MSEQQDKDYLGDGLYATDRGYDIALSAENGVFATDTVYLDEQVAAAFVRYLERRRPGFIAAVTKNQLTQKPQS